MQTPCGRYTISYNGEIYNAPELRTTLEKKGYTFRSDSDTEVLLRLFEEEGVGCTAKLNGIFAFAIWDAKEKELLCVRDHFGVKPLYYTQTSDGFLFASELKSLSETGLIDKTLNPEALASYLSYIWTPAPSTPFKNVYKLEPGTFLRIGEGKFLEKKRYYRIPWTESTKNRSLESCVAETREHLKCAVERQLLSDAPLGCFLSGGLDSSSIVALAGAAEKGLPCFTINSGDAEAKEGFVSDLPYARRVASHLGVELHEVAVPGIEFSDLKRMVYLMDEPLADPAGINALHICKSAREIGLKVLLSGAGGDDIFTGYRRHLALNYEGYMQLLPKVLRKGMREVTGRMNQKSASKRRLAKLFRYAHLSGHKRILSYFLWLPTEIIEGLFSDAFKMSLEEGFPYEDLILESLAHFPKGTPELTKMLNLDVEYFLGDQNFTYSDKMGMAESIEVRVPFLDKDLVEYAFSIPNKWKQNGKHGKWILKKAMEGILPQDVIYRPKSGFGVPLRKWLHGSMRKDVEAILSSDELKKAGIFKPEAVRKLLEADRAGHVDATYPILSIICIELWARKFAS